jgi:hypothetical protein
VRFRAFTSPAWRRRVAQRKIDSQLRECVARGFERAFIQVDVPEPTYDLAAILRGNGAILCVDCDGIEARTRAALETAIGASLDNLTFLRRYAGEDDATFRNRVISKM